MAFLKKISGGSESAVVSDHNSVFEGFHRAKTKVSVPRIKMTIVVADAHVLQLL